MISIKSITIKEFRGIRDLTIDLNGKSFGICGPNGTGKSGVVDALEFALTGNISRLSGEGRGDISLKEHGAHVDRRNDPEKAVVAITADIPSLRKTVTVERTVKAPSAAKVTPADADVLDVLRKIAKRPEIVLSRRELIRYVLATPGKRAEEVQALLHIEDIDKVRGGLQKLANAYERQLPYVESVARDARDLLQRALNVSQLRSESILSASNVQREILGLPLLQELTDKTSLTDGLNAPIRALPQTIQKSQASADLVATRETLEASFNAEVTRRLPELLSAIQSLARNPLVKQGMRLESFLTVGIELALQEFCPFCDKPWNLDELRKHVQVKLQGLKDVSRQRQEISQKVAPMANVCRRLASQLTALLRHAALPKQAIPMPVVSGFSAELYKMADDLERQPSLEEITVLLGKLVIPADLNTDLDSFSKAVAELPDSSKQDAAKIWLTVAQERLENYRSSMRKLKIAREQANIARQIFDTYTHTNDAVLTALYDEVQKDFAALYAFINRSDEKDFKAKLTPSMGKLGFDVDFYGRGFFPPGAYHSEGHQDGMGLCLYLALMRHLHGEEFIAAILDDVLMSVDSGHRREVCSLLKKEFPNTQFIMTTHDPIWLRHMRTEGLIAARAALQFRKWNVDTGPTQWDERDVWSEIGECLDNNDVLSAAGLLRHYLEYTAAEICHHLRAPVEFRGDAQYQLGELMPSAISRLGRLYSRGKDAANSWGQKEVGEELLKREAQFARFAQATNVEQWQVNSAIHFNNWENLGKNDFTPVAKAFQDLLGAFSCAKCNQYLRVTPEREAIEALRCDCGQTNVNLKKK